MGVLTHLDTFKNKTRLQKVKKQMKQRFWTEVYQGAKLFYLSGMVHTEYQNTEVHNLGKKFWWNTKLVNNAGLKLSLLMVPVSSEIFFQFCIWCLTD